ncbi:hypothetical protein SELMODRAFT_168384 [Selaginella moellendorffii]|uniref:Hcy-binding domain-containing protein n=1 Tax=Selaginella moellendorffii TaxID=88036 RepID=D8R6S2_SELML|nr:homocysteine S-methyltransferase 2 [Selaginella moellendorffii]EFJ32723.1 hypothetical protein SELMODRAFT_168384 [Selaginella moellendorffii]|eukprot:XP_002966696.1 homocysteine S-methyltransferase 2 [Selaginella moellendorffii]
MGAGKNKLEELLESSGGCAVLDGGLATQLEHCGADLNDPLWSALCLITRPQLIQKVHWDYLEAGADILVSSSYQATVQGFVSKGLSEKEGEEMLKKSVAIACQVRDKFWDKVKQNNSSGEIRYNRALVAASIGSYGAYLADGSEYSGQYGPEMMNVAKLKGFHRRRLQILASSGADLLAIETIPCQVEAQALVELLEEEDIQIPSWISFNSKDGANVVSGDPLSECVALAAKSAKVAAVGINCTPPRFIHGLVSTARKVTDKPIVVYPNSGETFDPDAKQWIPSTGVSDVDFVSYVGEWKKAGASLIGGCCRTTPATIRAIKKSLQK